MKLSSKIGARLRRWTYDWRLQGEVNRVVLKHWGQPPKLRLLVDTSLHRHAVNVFTNELRGEQSTFGSNPIWVGRLERRRKRLPDTAHNLEKEICYLPVLGALARKGILAFFTSPELDWELLRQKRSRPPKLGIDFLAGIHYERVPRPVERVVTISPREGIDTSGRDAQLAFFRSIDDPIFNQLKFVFQGQIADAFHLWTTERGGLDGFLTMDLRFVNRYRDAFVSKGPKFKAQPYLPSELCERLGARPLDVDTLGELADFWKGGW